MYAYRRDESDDGGIPRDPKRVPSKPTEPVPLTPPILYLLISLLAICLIFLLWRRARRLVTIAQPLRKLLRREGKIRLEEDAQEAGRERDEEEGERHEVEEHERSGESRE